MNRPGFELRAAPRLATFPNRAYRIAVSDRLVLGTYQACFQEEIIPRAAIECQGAESGNARRGELSIAGGRDFNGSKLGPACVPSSFRHKLMSVVHTTTGDVP